MKNYKQKEYVRIIANTTSPENIEMREMDNMIGGIYRVHNKWGNGIIDVCPEDNGSTYPFMVSDTQKVFIYDIKKDGTMEGCVKDGYAIGEGDVITYCGKGYIAYDAFIGDDGVWKVVVHSKKDQDYVYHFTPDDLKVTPKYSVGKTLSGKEVEVTIDGKIYKAVIK